MESLSKIGVIGAGTMGLQIAAFFAGCGAKVVLLDKNNKAQSALKKILTSNPKAVYHSADLELITTGDFVRDFHLLAECSWIIESATENLQVKKEIFQRLDSAFNAVISSNTSGMLLKDLVEGRTSEFKKRFCISHFFNPVRFTGLVEFVAGKDTHKAVLPALSKLVGSVGKKIITANDTPGFIANRIAMYQTMEIMREAKNSGWKIEIVDALMGRAACRDSSGVFRAIDRMGIDAFTSCAEMIMKGLIDTPDFSSFKIPQYVQFLLTKGYLGDKVGRGFYTGDKNEEESVFDIVKSRHRICLQLNDTIISQINAIESPQERLCTLVNSKNEIGDISWKCLRPALVYSAQVASEVACSLKDIDTAMKLGFNWELGPFEMWSALGLRQTAERIAREGGEIPAVVSSMLSCGATSFYRKSPALKKGIAGFLRGGRVRKPKGPMECDTARIYEHARGVVIFELLQNSKYATECAMELLAKAVTFAEKSKKPLVICSQGADFNFDFDAPRILKLSKEKKWSELESMVDDLQKLNCRIRFSKVPVVAALKGRVVGAGLELAMSCHNTYSSIETYAGFECFASGLIPFGGGCKSLRIELAKRHSSGPSQSESAAFACIARGHVSNSAKEAIINGYMKSDSHWFFYAEKVIDEAVLGARQMLKNYVPPREEKILVSGDGGACVLESLAHAEKLKGRIKNHDVKVAKQLAYVLCGGNSVACELGELDFLEREKRAFMSLITDEATQALLGRNILGNS